jgi:cytoskeletal protein CcmA (bactofilin family)
MFGRKGQDQGHYDPASLTGTVVKAENAYGAQPRAGDSTTASAAATTRGAPPVMPPQRRIMENPVARRSSYMESHEDMRRLTVGREITLTGEIATCDVLVVEGNVSATLRDGRMIEITEAGMFQGTVEIDNADIAGKFEGDLIVHDRLTVRSTGRISGRIQYGELEVQAGGQLLGEIQSVAPSSIGFNQTQPVQPVFKDHAKVVATLEDSQQDMLSEEEQAPPQPKAAGKAARG